MKIQEIIMYIIALVALGVTFYFWGDPLAIVAMCVFVFELLVVVYNKFIK